LGIDDQNISWAGKLDNRHDLTHYNLADANYTEENISPGPQRS